MPIVRKRIQKYFKDEILAGGPSGSLVREGLAESEFELLKTIKFSKNLFKLKLP